MAFHLRWIAPALLGLAVTSNAFADDSEEAVFVRKGDDVSIRMLATTVVIPERHLDAFSMTTNPLCSGSFSYRLNLKSIYLDAWVQARLAPCWRGFNRVLFTAEVVLDDALGLIGSLDLPPRRDLPRLELTMSLRQQVRDPSEPNRRPDQYEQKDVFGYSVRQGTAVRDSRSELLPAEFELAAEKRLGAATKPFRVACRWYGVAGARLCSTEITDPERRFSVAVQWTDNKVPHERWALIDKQLRDFANATFLEIGSGME